MDIVKGEISIHHKLADGLYWNNTEGHGYALILEKAK